MDKLPPLGKAIAACAPKTPAIYEPLVLANRQAISSTPCKSFTYGPHPRQALDVYTPVRAATKNNAPILLFFYGGGLVRGGKQLPHAEGLVHANVGHFFAEAFGLTTVISDYRLMSHGAAFPSGGEDMALTVNWILTNLSGELQSSGPRDLFIMGNSAGGVHMSQYLFASELTEQRSKVLSNNSPLRLRGVVMLSVPFHFRLADAARAEMLGAFFGSAEQIAQRCPLGLLQSLAKNNPSELRNYSILVLNGELDPEDEILVPKEDFVAELAKVMDASFIVETMYGHNHISPPFGLGTGIAKEEAWGYQVGRWIDYVRSGL